MDSWTDPHEAAELIALGYDEDGEEHFVVVSDDEELHEPAWSCPCQPEQFWYVGKRDDESDGFYWHRHQRLVRLF